MLQSRVEHHGQSLICDERIYMHVTVDTLKIKDKSVIVQSDYTWQYKKIDRPIESHCPPSHCTG